MFKPMWLVRIEWGEIFTLALVLQVLFDDLSGV